MTMRSNGNSKIIGAAMAPIMALASAVRPPYRLPAIRMMTNVIPAATMVTGVIGSAGGAA